MSTAMKPRARRATAGVAAARRAAGAVPPVWRGRLLGAAAAAAMLAFGWFGWFRDSSFAQVEDVRVVGLTGPQAAAIRAELVDAGMNMTTLHVREDELREAVAAFPTVTRVQADGDFPHKLTITVRLEPPVGVITLGGARVPIGHDGSLLKGVRYDHPLPLIAAAPPVGTDRIESGQARRLLQVLVSAPDLMRRRVRDVRVRRERGIVVRLRRGPDLIFGDAARLRAKWVAATRVLASRSARGATYIDLRLPERPAAGGLAAESVEVPGAAPSAEPPAGTTGPGGATATPAPAEPAPPPAQPQTAAPAPTAAEPSPAAGTQP